ncbi:MAG TPA: hypothetical protein GXZ20_02505 [Halanaerobiaceae bacterium]|nr:hypothetical protein [Bacillota bacterium]HHU91995.1 hypothetical protein [Halanaerobiaceae bacterium]HOA40827.1 hypothetical protein [Halanaerobiales bacterium]HPZ62936.1 hypothetical protein [Halanaerobiales bacterium]HQD04159.1 hypothetical protein [Halanaerobiales bacterium]
MSLSQFFMEEHRQTVLFCPLPSGRRKSQVEACSGKDPVIDSTWEEKEELFPLYHVVFEIVV